MLLIYVLKVADDWDVQISICFMHIQLVNHAERNEITINEISYNQKNPEHVAT